MPIEKTITMVIVGLIGLIFLVGIICGLKRGVLRSFIRLITLILAALGAYLIVRYALGGLSSAITSVVRTFLTGSGGDTIAEIINASDEMMSYVIEVSCALVAPLLYMLVFVVLRLLSLLLYVILRMFVPNAYDHPIHGWSRLVGLVISCAGACLIAVSILSPLTGYINYAATAYPQLIDSGLVKETSVSATVPTTLTAMKDNKAVKMVNAVGGNFLFGQLTKLKGGTTATAEMDTLMKLIPEITELTKIDFSAMFEEDATVDLSPISEGILPIIEKSDRLKSVLAQLLSTAGGKWLNNEVFLTINLREQLPQEYNSALDGVLTRLSTSTKDTVIQDLNDLTDTVELLADTYSYLVKVSNTTVTMAELKEEMSGILKRLTPGTAELMASAMTGEILDNANLGNNSNAVAEIMANVFIEVAKQTATERASEAEAMNQLISYVSGDRTVAVNSADLVDIVLSSDAVSTAIVNQTDTARGDEAATIQVTAVQKAAIEEKLLLRSTATEDAAELAAIEAMHRLFVVAQ